jgi:hypothetical protein
LNSITGAAKDRYGQFWGSELIEAHWCSSWKRVAPRSKPELALELAPFIAALQGDATDAYFIQQIEQNEWPYHSQDVPRCLKRPTLCSTPSRLRSFRADTLLLQLLCDRVTPAT